MPSILVRLLSGLKLVTLCLALAACSGGGGGGGDAGGGAGGGSGGGSGGGTGGGGTIPPTTPPPVGQEELGTASRFLAKASFGASYTEIEDLAYSTPSIWFRQQLALSPTLHLAAMEARTFDPDYLQYRAAGDSFWDRSINAPDQLRQRMAFALSQIFVVSDSQTSVLHGRPETMAHFMDVLTRNAFGNYRDLLQDVTYSPAMAAYLTFLYNEKADMATGRVPDENYAREIMQLFTIGLVQLNMDGTPVLSGGDVVETYDNDDVTGLARVFTGLGLDSPNFWPPADETAQWRDLVTFEAYHSTEEKRFLGTVIPPGTGAEASINTALDTLFEHPNLAPFVSRQLIQRFTQSHPDPAYVARVANAFEAGSYRLPDGSLVGEGQRGDLAATLAAILFDSEANIALASQPRDYGKIREPVIRFVHWARAFGIDGSQAFREDWLWDTGSPGGLAQHPYRSPSVFNFYRPGYVAPGTASGAQGMTAPELQIVNEASVIGFANFMSPFITDQTGGDLRTELLGFHPDYTAEVAMADDIDALIDRLDVIFTGGTLSTATRDGIASALNTIEISETEPEEGRLARVQIAILMVMTSHDYAVQR